MFVTKGEGSRKSGRPRMSCLECVEKDIRDTKAKRWRQKAVDREKWASVFKKAKA